MKQKEARSNMYTNQLQDMWSGYGSSPQAEVQDLLKALEAQQGITDISQLQSVGALQPQSLEGTLAMLTFTDKHLTLWKDIPKGNAFSTLEEYSVQLGYGTEGAWMGQMESPLEADPQAKRKYAETKFLRQLWKVSDVAGIVTTIKDPETWAKQSATMRLLRHLNTTLYTGDSSLIAEQIDGFEVSIRGNGSTDHVKDLRGGIPTEQDFRELAELLSVNYGTVEGCNLYCSPGGITTLDQILPESSSGTQRYLQATVGADGGVSIGSGVKKIHTSFGTIIPKMDIFLAGEYESRTVPKVSSTSNPEVTVEGRTSERSPLTPSISVATSGSAAGSKWAATGVRPQGAVYNYKVAAGNRFGLSKGTAAAFAGGNVVTGGKNTVTITPNGNSVYPATYYEIYSEKVAGSGDFRFVDRVADSGSATTTFDDLNLKIPGTTRMFLLDLTSVGEMRTFMLGRLAPLHSQQFAKVGSYVWGNVNLYVNAKYYAPLRFAMLENVQIGIESKNPLLNV
jgi:hypothetical protein